MSRRWVRTEPGRRENALAVLASAAVAACAGVVTFYLVRVFTAREPLALPERRSDDTPRVGSGDAEA